MSRKSRQQNVGDTSRRRRGVRNRYRSEAKEVRSQILTRNRSDSDWSRHGAVQCTTVDGNAKMKQRDQRIHARGTEGSGSHHS